MGRLVSGGARLRTRVLTRYAVNRVSGTTSGGQAFVGYQPVGAPPLPVAVWSHGLNSTPAEIDTGNAAGLAREVAATGTPVIAGQEGQQSPPLYANDTQLAAVDDVVDHARTNMGAAPAGIVHLGQSGGGQVALVHTSVNLADVVAVCLWCPLVDPNGWFLLNAAGIVQAGMNAAYAPQTWADVRDDRDPTVLAQGGVFDPVPIRLFYGVGTNGTWNFGAGNVAADGDGIIPAQSVTTFAAAAGATATGITGWTHFGPLGAGIGPTMRFLTQHITFPGAGEGLIAAA